MSASCHAGREYHPRLEDGRWPWQSYFSWAGGGTSLSVRSPGSTGQTHRVRTGAGTAKPIQAVGRNAGVAPQAGAPGWVVMRAFLPADDVACRTGPRAGLPRRSLGEGGRRRECPRYDLSDPASPTRRKDWAKIFEIKEGVSRRFKAAMRALVRGSLILATEGIVVGDFVVEFVEKSSKSTKGFDEVSDKVCKMPP